MVRSSGQSEDDRQNPGQGNRGWIEEFVGDLSFRNIVRVTAISAAMGLIGYLIYRRFKRSKGQKELKS